MFSNAEQAMFTSTLLWMTEQSRVKRCIEAQKKYYKKTTLQDMDVEIATIRAYLRLSFQLGFLPMKKYEVWSGMVVEIGKMLGGWLKSVNNQKST